MLRAFGCAALTIAVCVLGGGAWAQQSHGRGGIGGMAGRAGSDALVNELYVHDHFAGERFARERFAPEYFAPEYFAPERFGRAGYGGRPSLARGASLDGRRNGIVPPDYVPVPGVTLPSQYGGYGTPLAAPPVLP